MSEFTPPVRSTVNLRDAFADLIGKDLIKDLHDDEEICPVCNGLGIRIVNNVYGLSDDTTHPRLSFPYQHQSITFCNNCYNGVIHRCKYCGKQMRRGWLTCDCEEVQRQKRENERAKLQADLDAAEKHEPEALGTTFPAAYGDYPYNDGYFFEWQDFFDGWFDEHVTNDPKPKYVWAAEKVEMSFYADSIVESACEDLYEDAITDIGDQAIRELQTYLNEWAMRYGPTSVMETHRYAIRIPWEDINESPTTQSV